MASEHTTAPHGDQPNHEREAIDTAHEPVPTLPLDAVSEAIAARLRTGDFAVGERFPMTIDSREVMVRYGGKVDCC